MNPTSAFITFESEAAYNAMAGQTLNLFANETKFQEATEPTNIIWENRYVSNYSRTKRAIYFTVVLSILFACTFAATFAIKSQADKIKTKYESATCEGMK